MLGGQVLTVSRFILSVCFLVVCAFAIPSYAAESLDFIDKNNAKAHDLANISDHYRFSRVARVDLNNDSIDEFILARAINDTRNHFDVVATTGDGLAELGSFEARKMMVAYDEHHGVRSLLSFNHPDNDFDYDVYQWDAAQSRFVNIRSLKNGSAQ